MVRIAVGKADGLSASEGTVLTMFAYNEQKGFIGQYSSGSGSPTVEAGSFLGFPIDQGVTDDSANKGSGQQPTYLQLIASDNAICIAYIALTWSDGTKRGWVGDVGMACCQNWFHSDVFVGDDQHQAICMWLDGNHTNDIASAGIQIHIEDFTNLTSDYSKDINRYCSPPASIFHKDVNWLGLESFWIDNQNKRRSDDNSASSGGSDHEDIKWSGPISSRAINSPTDRRSIGKRALDQANPETEMVTSARPAHTVSQHCGDHTFVGP